MCLLVMAQPTLIIVAMRTAKNLVYIKRENDIDPR